MAKFRPPRLFQIGCLIVGFACPANLVLAGSLDGRPKIVLHLPPGQAATCQTPIADCSNAATAGRIGGIGIGEGRTVYLLLERGFISRPAEIRFGLSYQQNCPDNPSDGIGIDILSWTSCMRTRQGNGEWPAPGSSLDFFTECPPQPPPLVVLGSFYLSAYSADTLRIDGTHISRPGGFIETCNSGSGYDLYYPDFGSVVFSSDGQTAGCNPCVERCPDIPTPVPPAECFPGPPPPPPENSPKGDILLHIAPVTGGPACQGGSLTDCGLARVTAPPSTPEGPFYHVYLLARRRSEINLGLAGLQCGIQYDNGNPAGIQDGLGIDIYSWSLCADLQFPSSGTLVWPEPGSANLMTWASETHCQTGNVAVAGYFYLASYGAGRLEVTPRSIDDAAKLADCQSAEFDIPEAQLGWASFSGSDGDQGCNPCLTGCGPPNEPVSAVPTTWSAIKALVTAP